MMIVEKEKINSLVTVIKRGEICRFKDQRDSLLQSIKENDKS